MDQISASVGRGGVNRRDDVIVVQRLINAHLPIPLAPLVEDGICGSATIFAIEEYQRINLGMNPPDGRVDPNGKTFQSLIGNAAGPVDPAPISRPDISSVLRPTNMRESAWQYLLLFTKKNEGAVLNMYNNRRAGQANQDVTCGIGVRIDPRSNATQSWLKAMFYEPATNQVPTDDQMLADWDAAASLTRTDNNLEEYSRVCKLKMHGEQVYERMALILRDDKLTGLLTNAVCRDDFSDFANFPAAAQVFSLSFAYTRIPFDFPNMRAAIRAQHWADAAEHCHLQGLSELKNVAHQQLLLFAQSVVDENRSYDEVPSSIL